jgi:hypothetical protein
VGRRGGLTRLQTGPNVHDSPFGSTGRKTEANWLTLGRY